MSHKSLILALLPVWIGVETEAMQSIAHKAYRLPAAAISLHHQHKSHIHTSNQLEGPIAAAALYWITKVTCWSGVTIAGTAVVAGAVASATVTGGASVAVPLAAASATTGGIGLGIGVTAKAMGVGAAKGIAGGAVKLAVGTALTTTATTGAGIAATAAAGPVGATIIAPLTVAGISCAIEAAPAVAATVIPIAKTGTVVLATTGKGMSIAAGIESLSTGAYALGMMIPWF